MSKKDGFSKNVNEMYLNTQKEFYPSPAPNLTPRYTVLSGWKSQISNAIHGIIIANLVVRKRNRAIHIN